MFDELNKLNTSMQGPHTNILDLSDKINGFTEKVRHWIERVRNGVTAMIPCYTELNDGERVDISDTICAHLTVLVDGFRKYFVFKSFSTSPKTGSEIHLQMSVQTSLIV